MPMINQAKVAERLLNSEMLVSLCIPWMKWVIQHSRPGKDLPSRLYVPHQQASHRICDTLGPMNGQGYPSD